MKLSWAVLSDPGLRRSTNEDSYCTRADLGLYVVADGMGGHVAGEVASRVAVETIQTFIADAMADSTDLRGMATTASAVLVGKEIACVGHVGDSRVYALRDGSLEQITADHSWVE